MNLNATYSSTASTTYSAKSAVTVGEAQEKNLSAKEIINGYITQYMEEVLVEEYNDGFEFNMMTWVNDGKVNVNDIALLFALLSITINHFF